MPKQRIAILLGLLALCAAWLPAHAATVPTRVMKAASEGWRVWVFLHDKGPSDYTTKLTAARFVSARAMARIAERGGSYQIDHDWPVYPEYSRVLRDAGLDVRVESRLLNAVSGTADSDALEAIAGLAFVDSIGVVMRFRRSKPDVGENTALPKPMTPSGIHVFDYGNSQSQIEAIEVDHAHADGLDGEGVFLCFLDTGFDLEHPAFDSLRLIATYDFINHDEDVDDEDFSQIAHGTATLSTCAGLAPGTLIGVAPRADYALGKTENIRQEEPVEEDDWIDGAEWADSLGCDIISSSVGYTEYWHTYEDLDGNTAAATIAADLLAARGVLTVNSAGNEGNKVWRYIIVPSDGDSVLAVGATSFEGVRAFFSSRGPTPDGRIKPDVMAPGVSVVGANGGGTSYGGKNGTSFSAPLVAGLCALMLQRDPSLTPWQIIERLRETSTQADDPDTLMGWGIVQATKAIQTPVIKTESQIEIWPNPTPDGHITIVTPDTTAGITEYQVFTISGQNVRTDRFEGSSGTWDGRNEDGQPVASGIYLIRVITPVREDILKVAIMREQ